MFNTLIGKVDKRWFIGIPSPTAAALVIGLVWMDHNLGGLPLARWWCLIITLFAGLSMVAQVRFWSFKEINVRRKVPFFGLLLAVIGFLVITWEPSLVLFLLFLAYSLSGYVMWFWQRDRKQKEQQEAEKETEAT